MVTRLIALGSNPDIERGYRKESIWNKMNPLQEKMLTRPIHLAAARTDYLNFAILTRLFAGGANAFLQDELGNTAMHILFKNKKEYAQIPDITLILIVQDLQKSLFKFKIPEPKNLRGTTPLLLAVKHKDNAVNRDAHFYVVNELLAFGANPDTEMNDGWSPLLYYAGFGKDPDIFTILLEASKKACKLEVDGLTIFSLLKDNVKLSKTKNFDDQYPYNLVNEKCS